MWCGQGVLPSGHHPAPGEGEECTAVHGPREEGARVLVTLSRIWCMGETAHGNVCGARGAGAGEHCCLRCCLVVPQGGLQYSVPHALEEHAPCLAGPLPVEAAGGGGDDILITSLAGGQDAAQALMLIR